MSKSTYFVIFGLILASVFVVSCDGNSEDVISPSEADERAIDNLISQLPPAEDLFLFGNSSHRSGEILTLALHGGPVPILETDYFTEQEDAGIPIAYVREYQMLFPECIGSEVMQDARGYNVIGLPDSAEYVSVERSHECFLGSVAILRKVVRHFQNMGVSLNLMGHSIGAFISNKYLATYSAADFENVVLGGVRFDMPQLMVDTFSSGGRAIFPDGIEPVVVFADIASRPPGSPFPEPFDTEVENVQTVVNVTTSPALELGRARLQSSAARERYTVALEKFDLMNVTVFSGLNDGQVGRLSDDETMVLRNSGATVNLVEDGHGLISATADIVAILQP